MRIRTILAMLVILAIFSTFLTSCGASQVVISVPITVTSTEARTITLIQTMVTTQTITTPPQTLTIQGSRVNSFITVTQIPAVGGGYNPTITVTAMIPNSYAIESYIDGTFEGWDGDTLFLLTNGQVWQQSSYAYTYHYAYRPLVVIYPSIAGYKMTVAGVNGTIYVTRLK
jgi:hypothetical protein